MIAFGNPFMKNVAAEASYSLSREPSRKILSILSGTSAIAARAVRKYPSPSMPHLITSGVTSLTKVRDLLSKMSVMDINSTDLSSC